MVMYTATVYSSLTPLPSSATAAIYFVSSALLHTGLETPRVYPVACTYAVITRSKELIAAVAAGKSYSLASNVQGQLFAWGKGWMGEIGLGKDKDYRVSTKGGKNLQDEGFTRCQENHGVGQPIVWLFLRSCYWRWFFTFIGALSMGFSQAVI